MCKAFIISIQAQILWNIKIDLNDIQKNKGHRGAFLLIKNCVKRYGLFYIYQIYDSCLNIFYWFSNFAKLKHGEKLELCLPAAEGKQEQNFNLYEQKKETGTASLKYAYG